MKLPATVQHNPHKERASALMREIMKTLRWDEMTFTSFQFDSGLAYLKNYLKDDEHAISVISASSDFWAWWRNHWTNRDQAFIEYAVNTTYNLRELRETYRETHDAETLAKAIYPNGAILNESYAKMITELVQHEMQKV